MSVTHETPVRSSISSDAILASIDADAAAGYLELQTSTGVEAATITLNFPAGTVSAGVLTFSVTVDDPSATGGIVDRFTIFSNGGTEILHGSVGLTGEDINLSTLTIPAGDIVQLAPLSYTAPV